MPKSAATRHLVERCPSCGVEHDISADSLCEACDTPLRYWCRAHGRETGWLDGAACARCAEEAARPAARRRSAAALPCPDVSRAIAPAAPVPPSAVSASASAAPPAAPARAARGEVAKGAEHPERTPDSFVGQVVVLLFILVMTVGGGALGGAVLGIPFVLITAGDTVLTLQKFAVGGGIVGLLFGVYSFGIYLAEQRARRRRD